MISFFLFYLCYYLFFLKIFVLYYNIFGFIISNYTLLLTYEQSLLFIAFFYVLLVCVKVKLAEHELIIRSYISY